MARHAQREEARLSVTLLSRIIYTQMYILNH